jgi:hypothetical protein
MDQRRCCHADSNGCWHGARHTNRNLSPADFHGTDGTLSTLRDSSLLIDCKQYIIANLGFSLNFGDIDFEGLTFPTTMSIDYIRVYQPKNAHNIGCDPPERPTLAYIEA